MKCIAFPVIDPVATGENIQRLRREKGLSVKDLQTFFGFEEPQAIYKWQRGKSLPSVDNLYALSVLLNVPMDDILVTAGHQLNRYNNEQQAVACCSAFYSPVISRATSSPSVSPPVRLYAKPSFSQIA